MEDRASCRCEMEVEGEQQESIPSGEGNWQALVPQPQSGHVRTLRLAVENKDMELVKGRDTSW